MMIPAKNIPPEATTKLLKQSAKVATKRSIGTSFNPGTLKQNDSLRAIPENVTKTNPSDSDYTRGDYFKGFCRR